MANYEGNNGKIRDEEDSLTRMIKIKDKTMTDENSITQSFYNFFINTGRVWPKKIPKIKKSSREVLALFNK